MFVIRSEQIHGSVQIHGVFPFATLCLWKNVSHSIFNQSLTRKLWRKKIFEKMKVSFTRKVWRKEITPCISHDNVTWCPNIVMRYSFWYKQYCIATVDSQAVWLLCNENTTLCAFFNSLRKVCVHREYLSVKIPCGNSKKFNNVWQWVFSQMITSFTIRNLEITVRHEYSGLFEN